MSSKRDRLSTKEDWDAFFEVGSSWEANRGSEQTRLFAESFCKHTDVDFDSVQSILDSSCAMGDALPVFRKHFPKAQLYACDFSKVAISRCKKRYSDVADFYVASFEDISGMYDVIFSSATLEHFTDYKEKARALLRHCRYLCILVPYNEQRFGNDLEYDQHSDHVVTFTEHSFDFLLGEGYARRIDCPKSFYVPKAWSWTLRTSIIQTLKNIICLVMGRSIMRNRKMILFEIERNEKIRDSI